MSLRTALALSGIARLLAAAAGLAAVVAASPIETLSPLIGFGLGMTLVYGKSLTDSITAGADRREDPTQALPGVRRATLREVVAVVLLLIPSLIASALFPDDSNLVLLGPLAGSAVAALITSIWLRGEEKRRWGAGAVVVVSSEGFLWSDSRGSMCS